MSGWIKSLISIFILLFFWFAITIYKIKPRVEKPISGKIKIACLGDSITFGAGVIKTRKKDAWIYILNKLLGESYQVMNYGVSGTTLQKEGNLPYRRFKFLEAAKTVGPAMYIVMFGTNDSKPVNWDKERYSAQLNELIRELKMENGQQKVIVMAPPCAFEEKKTGKVMADINNEVIGNEVNQIVKAMAEKYQLPSIDLYAFTKDHPEYFADGVHPNKEGNYLIAQYVFKTVSEYLDDGEYVLKKA